MKALLAYAAAAALLLDNAQALLAPRPQQRRTQLRATSSVLERDVARLAERSASWAEAKAQERAAVAEACLECLRAEPWDAGWLGAQTDLESTNPSQTRYVFGAVVGDWLEPFIDARSSSSRTREAFEKGERVPLGLAVPGATAEIRRGAAEAKQANAPPGTVSVVLGAGNQSFLALIDVLQRALIEGECVVLKHHPLRPFLLAPYAAILAPLIELDVVAQVLDEGVEAAAALVAHDKVGHVHLTGGEATRDAVRRTLDAAGKTSVEVTAELGCVTPWLVAGGEWTAKELKLGARNLVAAKKANGGSNCLSPQVVVVAKDWTQRGEFLERVEGELKRQRDEVAYYPGARERRDNALEACGEKPLGASDAIGFSRNTCEMALETEVFGPFLAVCEIEGGLLEQADFANEKCRGTLSCVVLTPDSLNTIMQMAVVDRLKYGSVSLNVWSAFAYTALARGATWGAHGTDDASGSGIIGNHYGITGVEKSVVRGGPLRKTVDLSATPPAVVFDALFEALVRRNGAGAVASVVARRTLGALRGLVPVGPRGQAYGGPPP